MLCRDLLPSASVSPLALTSSVLYFAQGMEDEKRRLLDELNIARDRIVKCCFPLAMCVLSWNVDLAAGH
jgi:hypothetical protein